MPTIIGNQDNGQARTLADAFARLGDNVWGQGAQTAALRNAQTQEAMQNAYAKSDANSRMTEYYNYLMAHGVDPNDAHGRALAAFQGPDAVKAQGAANLMGVATQYGAADPRTQAAQVASGQSYGNTAGDAQLRARTQENVAHIQGQEARTTDLQKQDRDIVGVRDPATGQTKYVTKAEAQRQGLQPIMTKDQVVGGMLQNYAQPQQPAAPQQVPAAPQYPAPSFDINGPLAPPPSLLQPNGNDVTGGATVDRPTPPVQPKPAGVQPATLLPQSAPLMLRKEVGEGDAPMPMIQPGPGGGSGLSYDKGVTVTTQDGRTVPATGWTPVGPETGADQVRLQQVQSTVKPFLATENGQGADPAKSAIFANIRKLGGPKQFAVNDVNTILAATGLSNLVRGGMVGNDVNAAQANLEVFNNQMLKGLGVSSNPGVKEQGHIAQILPSSGFFTNSAVEAQKVPVLANALLSRNDLLVKQIQNAPTLQAAAELRTQLAENEKALQMLTSPNWGNAPFDVKNATDNADAAAQGRAPLDANGKPQAAPSAAPITATGPNGQKVKLNPQTNQWEPM